MTAAACAMTTASSLAISNYFFCLRLCNLNWRLLEQLMSAELENGFALANAAKLVEGAGDAIQASALYEQAATAFREALPSLDLRTATMVNEQIASLVAQAEALRPPLPPAAPPSKKPAAAPDSTAASLQSRLDALSVVAEQSMRQRLDALHPDPQAHRREREELEAEKQRWLHSVSTASSGTSGGSGETVDELLATFADELRVGRREAQSLLAPSARTALAPSVGDGAPPAEEALGEVPAALPAPSAGEIDALLARAHAELLVPAAPGRCSSDDAEDNSEDSADVEGILRSLAQGDL